jgi:hypothetical protein
MGDNESFDAGDAEESKSIGAEGAEDAKERLDI